MDDPEKFSMMRRANPRWERCHRCCQHERIQRGRNPLEQPCSFENTLPERNPVSKTQSKGSQSSTRVETKKRFWPPGAAKIDVSNPSTSLRKEQVHHQTQNCECHHTSLKITELESTLSESNNLVVGIISQHEQSESSPLMKSTFLVSSAQDPYPIR